MLKLKLVTPVQSIKNGSFEAWVLAVVSTVKATQAESALPSYMFEGGVTISDLCSSSNNKYKAKGKTEETAEMEPEHQTVLSTIVLN
jgi:hypothetical protein